MESVIRCDHPAADWANGAPIGNGRLGAMVPGGTEFERIALNHDLLWRNYISYPGPVNPVPVREFREKWQAGDFDGAYRLLEQFRPLGGLAMYVNPFVPAGDLTLRLKYQCAGEISDYERTLDTVNGIAGVGYRVGEFRYTREVFASYPDSVIVTRMKSDNSIPFSAVVTLSRFPDHDCDLEGKAEGNTVTLDGTLEEGVRFCVMTRVLHTAGRLTRVRPSYSFDGTTLPPCLNGFGGTGWRNAAGESFEGPALGCDTCYDVTLLTCIATSDETDENLHEFLTRRLDAAERLGYEALRERHTKDFSAIMNRVELSLEGGEDVQHVSRLFSMSRYISVSAGRPEKSGETPKAPINLQGLWNEEGRVIWDSDYHLDLNLEMCYWSLDRVNLGDFMGPLKNWVERMLPIGRRQAREIFDAEGLCLLGCGDNRGMGDFDTPCICGNAIFAWLLQLLWIHYEYTMDENELKNGLYALLKEAGLFFESFLTEDKDGTLCTLPSWSPEMRWRLNGRQAFAVKGSSFDLELIREVFEHLLSASETLGTDEDKRPLWKDILSRLPYPRVMKDGRVAEWLEPAEYIEEDPGHRHRSNLVGICPGNRINLTDTPELMDAVRQTVMFRVKNSGDSYTPAFSPVLDGLILARTGDGDGAWQRLNDVAKHYSLDMLLLSHIARDVPERQNWLGEHILYQQEAGAGIAASVAELFLQDGGNVLRLLPALPKALPCGFVRGLKARGGYTVDIAWKDGQLESAEIVPAFDGAVRVCVGTGNDFKSYACKKGQKITIYGGKA